VNEQEAMELNVAVAKAEGWTWFWSKHNYWSITRPDGKSFSAGLSRYTDYDPDTGKKNKAPDFPTAYDLDYHPDSDPAEAMRLLEKYKMLCGFDTIEKHWFCGPSFSTVEGMVAEPEAIGETPCIAIARAVVALKGARP
jgi:hypothetical protein